MTKQLKSFQRLACQEAIKIVSVDIFDTLLLRKPTAEGARFYNIAQLHSDYLKENHQLVINPLDLLLARLEAAHTVYRTKTRLFGAREATIEEIYQLLFKMVGVDLDKVMLEALIGMEMNYELTELYANQTLIDVLRKAKKSGKTIVGISDMYLRSEQIKVLVNEIAGNICDELISSADYGYGKGSGQLFLTLAKKFDIPFTDIVHCGDNVWSDFTVPASMQIASVHTPRHRFWRLKRAVNQLSFKFKRVRL